jgi:hypothetical protein
MSRDIHTLTVGSFGPMLTNLSAWIDKAAAGGAEPAALIEARLAPDMFDLAQQVRLACRHATETVGRLTGRPPIDTDGDLNSLAELKALIARTVAALQAAPASAFAGAEDRDVRIPLNDQMQFRFSGERLVRDWGLPHFYFHLVTAYGILRSQGAPLGKQDLAQVADAITPIGAP